MAVFGDLFRKYLDHGLHCIPIGDDKNPIVSGFDVWSDVGIDEKTADNLEKNYSHLPRIGLLMGKASGLIAFDFDYEYHDKKSKISKKDFELDKAHVEREILRLLPQTPAIKVGKKGWTRFYKWTAEWGESSNYQCDRNGIRLFDFIAWHKQTVIPPSLHSTVDGEATYYKWIGAEISSCLDDIPELDRSIVETIQYKFSQKRKGEERHDKLFDFIVLQLRLGVDPDVVAKKLVEHDKKIHGAKTYLDDKKYNRRLSSEAYARKWIERCLKYAKDNNEALSSPVISDNKLINNRDYFFELFPVILGEHRVDLLSKKFMRSKIITSPNGKTKRHWSPIMNNIASIRSDCHAHGFSRSYTEDHLSAYKDSLKPELLIDIKEWDNIDRIDTILRFAPARNLVLNGASNDDYEKQHAMYLDIVKDISGGTFRRVFDSNEQNLCTIFRGGQGIGKNTFIAKVWGEPFDDYFSEINIYQDQQKNYDAVKGKIICVIGEFDQTNKAALSFVKELITNASSTYRSAYAHESETHTFHHTLFSASNFDNVLKDTSGNRRYAIFDLDFINYEYTEHCDKEQLLAQFYHLYKTNYRMSDASKEWLKAFNASETPDDPITGAIDLYKAKVKLQFGKRTDRFLDNVDVIEILSSVSRATGVKDQWIRQTLKRVGLSVKTKTGVKFLNIAE